MKRIQVSVAFDTLAQKALVKKAAKVKRWSMSKFLVYTAEAEAVKILANTSNAEQLIDRADPLPLNQ